MFRIVSESENATYWWTGLSWSADPARAALYAGEREAAGTRDVLRRLCWHYQLANAASVEEVGPVPA